MTLLVDFNRRDARGYVPAFVDPRLAQILGPGEVVLAEDDEGTTCKAVVHDVQDRTAYLELLPGTAETSSRADMLVDELRSSQSESA